MSAQRKQRMVAGSALIVMGLGLYWLHKTQGIDEAAAFFLLGGAFLAGYLYNKTYGFLVPAGVLLGMGAGLVGEDTIFDFGRAQLLGLGLGFVMIYAVPLLYERKSRWWPLVPGTVLILLGIPKAERVFGFLYHNWPLILVIAGVLVLLGAFGRSGAGRGEGARGG